MVTSTTHRILGRLGAIVGASILAFALLRVIPGDPARLELGPFATEAQIRAFNKSAGLTLSLPEQYWRFVKGFADGSWGYSTATGENVSTLIGGRLSASLELGLYAFSVALVAAVVLALLSTYRRRRPIDAAIRGTAFVALGTPPFWLALLLLLLLSQVWHVLPGPEGRLSPNVAAPPSATGFYTVDAVIAGEWSTAWDAARHLLLPTFALAFAPWAFMYRLLRANLLDVAREPFLLVARSKGNSRWTAFRRHALPNAFLPTLTVAGLVFSSLIAGSVLIEKIFNWPGLGSLVVDSILRHDFGVVEAFILLTAITYVAINTAVDILYGVVDPRVRAPQHT